MGADLTSGPSFAEPPIKRVIAFVDGQNLFYAAKQAFGYDLPNFDIRTLSRKICEAKKRWELVHVYFYTGTHTKSHSPFWHGFWVSKLRTMSRQENVTVFSRTLRYRQRRITPPGGTPFEYTYGDEKGVDVRIAIDVIRMAHKQDYDIAMIFSQDQDLSEVAKEIRSIAKEQKRWMKAVSVFPVGASTKNRAGIAKTDWIEINKQTYDQCLDGRDHRPKKKKSDKSSKPSFNPPKIK